MPAEALTWLVTGSAGFLGANAGAFLSGRAHRVGASRQGRPSALFDEVIGADLLAPQPLVDFIHDRRPQVILHGAALASHDRCESDPALAHAVNVEASVELARAARNVGSRFVLISSDAVFDGSRGGYSEGDSVNATSVYGQTKAEAERQVQRVADALIIRTNFFGWSPTRERSILEFFVNQLTAGRSVRGFTDFTTSSAYAQVLVDAISRLIDGGATGIFHVTSPDSMTKYEFGVAVADAFGLDAGLITPTPSDISPPRGGDISLDISKVQDTLGSRLPTIHDGIVRAHADAAFLREHLRSGGNAG